MDQALLRIIDAAANRAREGLRVLEDCARFALDDETLTESLKRLRHDLAEALALLPMNEALRFRDTPGDVGTAIRTESEFRRASCGDLVCANAKRLAEALRSLEECAKTVNPAAAAALEQLRYRSYTLEQSLLEKTHRRMAVERFGHVRLYILLTDSLCPPGGFEKMLEVILTAGAPASVSAGNSGAVPTVAGSSPLCIQLREKDLPDAEFLRRAIRVVRRCREAGVLSIINDRPDMALLAGADGVHLGQGDLPCRRVREMLGPETIVGVSTDAVPLAIQAVADGATYVAAGPMFPTTTKIKPRIVGPDYAAEVLGAVQIPVVAIGGITPENVGELVRVGIRTVAVSSGVLCAADPAAVIGKFLRILGAAQVPPAA